MELSPLVPFEPPTRELHPHPTSQAGQHPQLPTAWLKPPAKTTSSYLTALNRIKAPSSTSQKPALSRLNTHLADRLSPGPTPNTNPLPASGTKLGALDELSWSGSRLIWSRNGVPTRTFSFDKDGQHISQAIFAHLDLTLTDNEAQPTASTSATTLDSISNSSPSHTFGPFKPASPAPWTDDPLALPSEPSPSQPQQRPACARHLVVFLSTIAYAFPPSGRSIPFQLPFPLRRAWPIDRGVLLERAEEGHELLAGVGAARSTLFSLLDPAGEVRPVAAVTAATGLGFVEGGVGGLLGGASMAVEGTKAVADLDDRLVFAAGAGESSPPLLLSANAKTSVISLWMYAKLPSEVDLERVAAANGTHRVGGGWAGGAARQAGTGAGGGKGKERDTATPALAAALNRRVVPSANAPPASKRKRPSLGVGVSFGSPSAAGIANTDRLQRRASGLTPNLGPASGPLGANVSHSFTVATPRDRTHGHGHEREHRHGTHLDPLAQSAGAAGDTSAQLGEADLLEALGGSLAMRRMGSGMGAMSAAMADRRTSLTRNELSVTMDRMALGISGSAEMDREASTILSPGVSAPEDELPSDVIMRKVWEMQVDQTR